MVTLRAWRQRRFEVTAFTRISNPDPKPRCAFRLPKSRSIRKPVRLSSNSSPRAHSTGTVLNPLMHQGQIDGGVVMGMGYALMEEVDDRWRQSRSPPISATARFPRFGIFQSLKTVIQEFPVGNGPYGGMSIGEPPVVPTAAAIANAVHDAVGVRIYDLPITAEKVLRALKSETVSIACVIVGREPSLRSG